MHSWLFFYYVDLGSSRTTLIWMFGLYPIALQGTKISEDREILQGCHATSEGAPSQRGSARIIKYIGPLAIPEWKDVEPGRVFSFPWYPVKNTQSQKTSSRSYVVSRPTSPVLHIHQNS